MKIRKTITEARYILDSRTEELIFPINSFVTILTEKEAEKKDPIFYNYIKENWSDEEYKWVIFHNDPLQELLRIEKKFLVKL